MLLFQGFVHEEIVLIKRQTMWLLAGKCFENGFDYIPHNNINTRLHLNRDGIHLNSKGIYIKLAASLNIVLKWLKFSRNLQNFNLTDNLITEVLNECNHFGVSLSHPKNNSTDLYKLHF